MSLRLELSLPVLAGAMVLAVSGGAAAQTATAPSVSLNRFSPSEAGAGWFTADELKLHGHLVWVAGVITDEAYRPLVSRSETGGPDQAVVGNQLVTHLQGALTVADRYRVALSMPIVLLESGAAAVIDGVAYPAPSSGVGDPRLGFTARVFGDESRLTGAAGLQMDIPLMLGARRYGREDTVRLRPSFSVAGRRGLFSYAGRVGLLMHVPRELASELPLGTSLELGGAAGVRLWQERILLGPELYGSTMLDGDGPFKGRSTPLELLVGAHYQHESGVRAGLGLGTGLSPATGTPPFRFLLSVSYTPPLTSQN